MHGGKGTARCAAELISGSQDNRCALERSSISPRTLPMIPRLPPPSPSGSRNRPLSTGRNAFRVPTPFHIIDLLYYIRFQHISNTGIMCKLCQFCHYPGFMPDEYTILVSQKQKTAGQRDGGGRLEHKTCAIYAFRFHWLKETLIK